MSDVRTTQVDLAGLMSVLGEHLYSTPTVALRELVQNAHDAITRRKIEASGSPFEPRIEVKLDRARGTLTITDSGAGLTRQEIIDFLATIGAGYTRLLRQKNDQSSSELIGYFGLGFLSAFVVSERIEVRTTSWQSPGEGWLYRSRDGQRYSLESIPAREIGTEVELELKANFKSLLDGDELEDLLQRFCALLPLPVFLGGKQVNAEPPPWRTTHTGAKLANARREFVARFEYRFEPLCVIPIEPTAESDLEGLLWVQDARTYGTSDNRNLTIFVRGMMLDDDARELLPGWSGFIGGVVESSKLTPTASREDLQRDAKWDAAHQHLTESLIAGLARVARDEPEAWRRVLSRHNEALIGCALSEERLMTLLAEQLTVPTSEGDLGVRELLRRGQGRAFVSLGTRGGFEEMLFRALKLPIAAGTRYGVLSLLNEYTTARGGVVVELGTEQGNRHVFKRATLADDERAFLEELLLRPGQRLVAARFDPPVLPLVLVPDRDAELKARIESDDADKRMGASVLRLARLHTQKIDAKANADLYVNLDAPAIIALLANRTRGAEACAPAARLLRSLVALMAGWDEGSGRVDLSSALADFSATVGVLLPK